MTREAIGDTRSRLIDAAADLIAASPGDEISLRAICDAVGVKMPTLYHFFGSKQGLLDAVIEHGFDRYLEQKAAHESTGDPLQDIREGWDAHVEFGTSNPGFYTLMYGKVRPGYAPAAQARASDILLGLARQAADQGRLAVSPEQATAHILAANIGVTLRLIILSVKDLELSAAVREATIAAITGVGHSEDRSFRDDTHRLVEYATANPQILGAEETQLLRAWLLKLGQS
ncbi:MAG: TetR/AcrR family transcriptional regulator [Arthrobacter sp.]|nr:TetR/AcrR family transcriptional regulator [Arthrobacter sp.]